MALAAASKRRSAMAKSSACTVATVSAMIQRLTGSVASGARNMLLAPIPLAWQKRAAFQSLVAKLRYPSTRFSRSEEHTSELQSLMRISYAVFCLKKKTRHKHKLTYDR